MTTYTKPEIDWSAFPDRDDEPMAENIENAVQMMDLIVTLKALLRTQGRARYVVGGNQFLYYNQFNGRDHISPDVYVGFDVEPGGRPSWQTWVEGKAPDIVWEISSTSTQDEDIGHKRALYARLDVQEYYIFDPKGDVQPPFQGYIQREGRLEPASLLASGGIASALLRTELRPVVMAATRDRPAATYLRVVNPATGKLFPVIDQALQDYDDVSRQFEEMTHEFAEMRRITAERIAAEQQRADAQQQRADAEARLRVAAEARLRVAAEARLRVAMEQQVIMEQQRAAAEARTRIAMEQRMDVEVQLRQAHEQARRVAEEQAEQARAALAQLRQRQGEGGAPTESDA